MLRVALLLASLVALGCSSTTTSDPAPAAHPIDAAPSDGDAAGGDADAADATDAGDARDGGEAGDASDASDAADADPGDATFVVRGSVEQIYVTHADPDAGVEVRNDHDDTVAAGTTDHLGSLVFRDIPAGKGYRVHTVGAASPSHSGPVDVWTEAESQPPASFYGQQKLQPGNGYITTRDGTKLAVFVTLPGPISQGPYPTVVNYSGYDPARPGAPVVGMDQTGLCTSIPVLCDAPSDASALIAAVAGYATVSVNMRGTGCSGGAYDYFELLQLLDGYDVIETVAAQDWVAHHAVGMVGLSYPGITQLFVAHKQPPSLAAIAPLSVIGNTATTVRPGGILNSGFALEWIKTVYDQAAPYGQGWEQARVDGGDMDCKENQLLHDQRRNNFDEAANLAYYDPTIEDPLNPTLFAPDIRVPVFLACAFQDEQTGPFFTTLLDKLTGAPAKRITLYNGVHADGFAPQVLAEWKAFLDIYVAKQLPTLPAALSLLVPQLAQKVWGVSVNLPPNRWGSYATLADAKAAWEKEPPLRVLFENGAGAGADVGAPVAAWERSFSAWPPVETQLSRWYFQPDGSMDAVPTQTAQSASSFQQDPARGQVSILPSGDPWSALPPYQWIKPAPENVVGFTSGELAEDSLFLGTGSVDLWVRSQVGDADLQVTLSEVRPDGNETYVQSGWLRASYRKLSPAATPLWPEPSELQNDIAPMPVNAFEPVRVALAGSGHVFRKGSRIHIDIDTPGGTRSRWKFDLLPFPQPPTYDVAHSLAYPSSVALPLVPAMVTTPLPACPSLRGQPCRTWVDQNNTPSTL